MQTNIYRPYIGQCFSLSWAGTVRVIKIGAELSCFNGGRGVFETIVEEIPGWAKLGFSDPMTKSQLEKVEKTLNELEDTLVVR